MENKNLLKGLHAALALAALVVFLAAPFISYGGKYEVSGADLLERMDHDNGWLVLFVLTPVLAALSNLSDNRIFRGVASLSVLLPLLILLGTQESRMEFAAGGIIYSLIAIGLAILAFSTPSGNGYGQEKAPEPDFDSTSSSEPSALAQEVREYDVEKLNEIVSNATMYKPVLVERCIRELEIRDRAGALQLQVKEMQDDQLREKLSNPQLYSDELIYACEVELGERRRIAQEQFEREAEEARIQHEKEVEELRIKREKEEEEARLRRAARWKRWRPFVYAAILLAAGAAVTAYMLSNAYRYKRGIKFADDGLPQKAVGRLSLISDPDFEHYSEAKYLLYKQHLQLKDSMAAAAALSCAVKANDWKIPQAYKEYTTLCIDGSFELYNIPRSRLRAADIYRTSPDESDRVNAGKIYFEYSRYNDAYAVFSDLSANPTAKGYLGMIHLFGLANQSRDVDKAWDYLKDAPNTLPFVVHKGDLVLMLRKGKGNGYSSYPSIVEANKYYGFAARQAPDNKDYTVRYEVTKQIVAAKERNDNLTSWDSGRNWHSYTFDGGAYSGEYTGGYLTEGKAHGWGYFTWTDNEIRLGRYANGRSNGPGLGISKNRIKVGTLKGNFGTLVEGSYIWSDGRVWTGTWKDDKLVKGKKYNLHGKVIETVK